MWFKVLSILYLLIVINGCGSKKIEAEIKPLPHYPSASGIEYFNNKFYIIGDDANNLLLLDNSLKQVDSIPFYFFSEKRIPKSIKPDLESIALLQDSTLLIAGSGSSSPTRNAAWIYSPATKQKDSLRLDTFYNRLPLYGIKEINIEGITHIPGHIVLASRGNIGYPSNHLIITKNNFWHNQTSADIHTLFTSAGTDSNSFSGVSGLAYAAKSDALVMTVSTEDTRNALDDGAIGKSYIWIIKNISSKKKWKAVHPNIIIDLNETDNRFTGQKIESVCITGETDKKLHLVLAADNDNGSSTVFRITIDKD
jgi:hypothetical protein